MTAVAPGGYGAAAGATSGTTTPTRTVRRLGRDETTAAAMDELHADDHAAAVELMVAANRGKVIVTPSCEWVFHAPWSRWVAIPRG